MKVLSGPPCPAGCSNCSWCAPISKHGQELLQCLHQEGGALWVPVLHAGQFVPDWGRVLVQVMALQCYGPVLLSIIALSTSHSIAARLALISASGSAGDACSGWRHRADNA